MEYCCHFWAGAPSCYLDMLHKPQRRVCRSLGPSLAASLEPFAHRQVVASLSLLLDVLMNWLNWFYFLKSC